VNGEDRSRIIHGLGQKRRSLGRQTKMLVFHMVRAIRNTGGDIPLAWPGNTDARTIPSVLIWLIDPAAEEPRRWRGAGRAACADRSFRHNCQLLTIEHHNGPTQLQAEIARRSGTARLSEGIKMSWA
jgi:hypothetical protein